jgi:hypothetical protein
VGKVDQTDRAVDQRVTNSDQAQKAATGQANQTLLEEGGEVHAGRNAGKV